MLVRVHTENPEVRKIKQIVDVLQNGGIIVYPTDTVYALGCLANNKDGITRIHRIKGGGSDRQLMTIMSPDISETSKLTTPIPNEVFKLMKRNVPGPYTFILNANSRVPKMVQSRRKTIGFRIPSNSIAMEILQGIDDYLVSTSFKLNDEFYSDPLDIEEQVGKLVDVVIDGGILETQLSSIIDCTGQEPELIREGSQPIL